MPSAATPRSASAPNPASRAKPIPSSIVSKRLPSNRSGVCTVCPACRSSSANDPTPSVRPWTWWYSTTSVISNPPPRLIHKIGTFDDASLFEHGSQADPPGLRPRRPDRAHHVRPGQGDRPSPSHDDPRHAPRTGGDGNRVGGRGRTAEEHGRTPRQGARRGRAGAGGEDAAGTGDRGALLRPDGPDVLRRGRAEP